MKERLLGIVINLLPFILRQISEPLKDIMREWLNTAKAKAKETDNPVDDVLVELLDDLLNL